MSREARRFYVGGRWIEPAAPTRLFETVDPATEQPSGTVALGGAADVDRAVEAARAARAAWAATAPAERRAVLARALELLGQREAAFASAITDEMGCPATLSAKAQVKLGAAHLRTGVALLDGFEFEERVGATRVRLEPVGVCALITPWNWPLNQVACKVVPALAAGCTMVLKPSEYSAYSGDLWAELMHDAGVPPGVFNLVQGDASTGRALVEHPQVDLVSFTGSTRGGREVAAGAAATLKRVHLELGGKSPALVLDDADLAKAVKATTIQVLQNSGQSCNAPTRLFVPASRLAEAESIAAGVMAKAVAGDPREAATTLGPVVSRVQFERIQALLESGVREGARAVTGGPGRPAGVERGWFVQPTLFADLRDDMQVVREEIFGPVLCLLGYADEAEALARANATPYGLSAYVWAGSLERAQAVAARLEAGSVHLNGAGPDFAAPFGGWKQSGYGREWGVYGLRAFLEPKALLGAG
ncbi:MAG: aldehyde dehydrogenase family protein [Steroidobacteraceae bacterium]|nr:aldehyde dehydrogenase family protein [Steroidobacteraceae bacterium]